MILSNIDESLLEMILRREGMGDKQKPVPRDAVGCAALARHLKIQLSINLLQYFFIFLTSK